MHDGPSPPQRALRIVFLNWRDTRNPEGGGSEVYVESVARGLADAGHDVTVFCAAHANAPAEEVRDGVRYRRAGSKLGVYHRGRTLLRRGDLGQPDVVVDVQNGIPFLAPWATDAPVVVLVHHVHREQWPVVYDPVRARVGWWLESRLAPWVFRASRYVAVSAATRDELVGVGVPAAAIAVVHNGSEDVPDVGVPRADHPRILVLGRLVPHKRVEHVLRAAAVLRHRVPDLRVAVVGDGWWADELAAEARRLGVDDLVQFTGFVDEDRKHAELARAWVLALPSLKEGWGLVVMEAARHGVPSVAYRDAGGVAEAIVDGETGILVDGDEDAYAAALGRLLTDHALRERMGARAAERAREFSWQTTADRFAEVLAQALTDGPGHRRRVIGRIPVGRVRPAHLHHSDEADPHVDPSGSEEPAGHGSERAGSSGRDSA
ncbi:MAG: glycosyltransferase family 4 protein [Candidatus Nanopelagicales bacterium]